MISLKIPVIVEGKYDKARLSGVVDAVIVPTDGFAVFNNAEKRALIRRLGERGVILLCDSDGGGRQIRSRLRGMLGGIRIYDLYTPAIPGREPRKSAPSKAGILGVEGVPNEILREIFARFAEAHPELIKDGGGTAPEEREPVTPQLLYELGLSGGPDAARRRAEAAEALGLPGDMTAKAFCAAANLVSDAAELRRRAGPGATRRRQAPFTNNE